MVNICIPVLNAYDDLNKCIESIRNSTIYCDIYIIDNGGNLKLNDLDGIKVHTPNVNLGVAGSWNWFIDNVPQTRIITNDDIVFDQIAIERLWRNQDNNNLVFPENLGSPFSCFLLPDDIINSIGKFDEWVSPHYAYFEDNDYSHRMSLAGFGVKKADGSFVEHVGSSTLKHLTPAEEIRHHEKFRAARGRYVKKWGGEPGHEKFKTPFGR